jgi:hypothetical protein
LSSSLRFHFEDYAFMNRLWVLLLFCVGCNAYFAFIQPPILDCGEIRGVKTDQCCGFNDSNPVFLYDFNRYVQQVRQDCEHIAQVTRYVIDHVWTTQTVMQTDIVTVTQMLNPVTAIETNIATASQTNGPPINTLSVTPTTYFTEYLTTQRTATQFATVPPTTSTVTSTITVEETVMVTYTIAPTPGTVTQTITVTPPAITATDTIYLTTTEYNPTPLPATQISTTTITPAASTATVFITATETNTATAGAITNTITSTVTSTPPVSTSTISITVTDYLPTPTPVAIPVTTTQTIYSTHFVPTPTPTPNPLTCNPVTNEDVLSSLHLNYVLPVCSSGFVQCADEIYAVGIYENSTEQGIVTMQSWYNSTYYSIPYGISVCDFGSPSIDFDRRGPSPLSACNNITTLVNQTVSNNTIVGLYVGTHIPHCCDVELSVDFYYLKFLPQLLHLVVVPYTTQASNPNANISTYPPYGLTYQQSIEIPRTSASRLTLLNMNVTYDNFHNIYFPPFLSPTAIPNLEHVVKQFIWLDFVNCTLTQGILTNITTGLEALSIINVEIAPCLDSTLCPSLGSYLANLPSTLQYLSISGPPAGKLGLGWGVGNTYLSFGPYTDFVLGPDYITLELLEGLDLTQWNTAQFGNGILTNLVVHATFAPMLWYGLSMNCTACELDLLSLKNQQGTFPALTMANNATVDLRGNSFWGALPTEVNPFVIYAYFYLDNPTEQTIYGTIPDAACLATRQCQILGIPEDASGLTGICYSASLSVPLGFCCCSICTQCI